MLPFKIRQGTTSRVLKRFLTHYMLDFSQVFKFRMNLCLSGAEVAGKIYLFGTGTENVLSVIVYGIFVEKQPKAVLNFLHPFL